MRTGGRRSTISTAGRISCRQRSANTMVPRFRVGLMERLADLLPTGLGQHTTVGIGQRYGHVRQGRKIIENPLQGFDIHHIDKTIVSTHLPPLGPGAAAPCWPVQCPSMRRGAAQTHSGNESRHLHPAGRPSPTPLLFRGIPPEENQLFDFRSPKIRMERHHSHRENQPEIG